MSHENRDLNFRSHRHGDPVNGWESSEGYTEQGGSGSYSSPEPFTISATRSGLVRQVSDTMTLIVVDKGGINVADTIKDRPFKIAMSLFAIYSGISGIFNFGASNEIFDAAVKYSELFNIMFIAAGGATLAGVLTKKINVEAAGLCLVIVCMASRLLATLAMAGWNASAHNLLSLSVLFISASVVRLYAISELARQMKGRSKIE